MSRDLLDLRWDANLDRNVDGAPLLPPLFVAEQGPGVHLVDMRSPEATAVTGHIPGSVFVPVEQLANAGPDLPLVLVSAHGRSAAKAALLLEKAGMKRVAAMAGGVAAWRRAGLKTSRLPEGASDELYRTTRPGRPGGTLSLEEVSDHIGDPRTVRWIKLPALVMHGHSACVDGRDERGVVGTPGGDAGKFILALAAVEQATGTTLSGDVIAEALRTHIDTFGDFYIHTDGLAFEALIAAVDGDERLEQHVAGLKTNADWLGFVESPPKEARDALIEHLVRPAHIGCGHIRLMMQHSDEYGLRRELVASVVRSVFRLWWDGLPEVSVTLLPGEHAEGAVVNVRVEKELWGLSWVPLISPACGATQMFVNHPQVSARLRGAIMQFHLRGHGPVPVADREPAFRAAFAELAERHLAVTLGYLAKDLPVYEVTFRGDGRFSVHHAP